MAALDTAVSDLMISPLTGKVKFSFPSVSIDSTSYKEVKTAIDGGKITVVHDPKLGSRNARYRYTHNKILVGFSSITTPDQSALLVHECTHAVFDIAGKGLVVKRSEAAGYIAHCLYYYYANEAVLSSGKAKVNFPDPVLSAAWDVAAKARVNSSLTDDDLKALFAEIAKSDTYKDRYDKDEPYDGV